MRSLPHVIDTQAVKKVLVALPDHWVVRELTERDYGIDLMVEIFLPGLKDKRNLDAFEASGALFHLQVKGTRSPIKPSADDNVSYPITKSALRYVERFSVPFFLFRTDVSSPSGKIYFVWLQRYIRDVLDAQTPFWREKPEDTITIRIPDENYVNTDTIERIQKIALRPKYLEELIEFRDIFRTVADQLSAMFGGQHDASDASLEFLRAQFYRIRRLTALHTENDFGINRTSIDDVIQYLHGLDFTRELGDESRTLPHHTEFMLLFNSLDGLTIVESFAQECEGRTLY